jgi:O-methyltransferase involved in polyketide biosynthesis
MAVAEEDVLTSFGTGAGDEDGADPDFDTTVAHPARVWDFLLGGKDNFAADRTAGERVLQVMPEMGLVARSGREFLARAVHYLAAEAGIRQFLDIGTGLPTADNTHEVAQRAAPESRIVYVDNDPIVLTHARALLTSDPRGETAYISADIQDTDTILREAAHTLDLSQPVAVMLLAILHFIPDSDGPHAIVARLMEAVPPGSYLVISHASSDIMAETVAAGATTYNEHSAVSITPRTEQQVTQFFAGLDLVPPGVTPLGHWRPGPVNVGALPWLPTYTAVGRKP